MIKAYKTIQKPTEPYKPQKSLFSSEGHDIEFKSGDEIESEKIKLYCGFRECVRLSDLIKQFPSNINFDQIWIVYQSDYDSDIEYCIESEIIINEEKFEKETNEYNQDMIQYQKNLEVYNQQSKEQKLQIAKDKLLQAQKEIEEIENEKTI
jgi:hypothetical protein